MSNYRYTRNWENQQKHIFEGEGLYDIPIKSINNNLYLAS